MSVLSIYSFIIDGHQLYFSYISSHVNRSISLPIFTEKLLVHCVSFSGIKLEGVLSSITDCDVKFVDIISFTVPSNNCLKASLLSVSPSLPDSIFF